MLLVMAAGALLAAQGPIFAPSASDAGGAAPGLALRDVARVVPARRPCEGGGEERP